MTDSALEAAAHLHRQCSAVAGLTQWECVPLGTCLPGGGEPTHSLGKQAHMAIITLISGGWGRWRRAGVGGARLGRKMGMRMAAGRGSQGFPGTRLKAGLASVVGSRSLSGFNRALWKTG